MSDVGEDLARRGVFMLRADPRQEATLPARLTYDTLEKLAVRRPVDRLDFMTRACHGKVVLDIGCLDETALVKRDTEHWLHGRLARVARQVVGVDSSELIPAEGIATAPNARIHRGNALALDAALLQSAPFEVVVAGEFIEHIGDVLQFFDGLRRALPGRELLISTPNGASFANFALGLVNREAQHPDHLATFTFKVLNTLCRRAGFADWEVLPYRFFATDMILKSAGAKRAAAKVAERGIRTVEWFFPLLSFGYVVRARL